jgi:hypothetical protein
MGLGSTQRLIEMSNSGISPGGQPVHRVDLDNFMCSLFRNSGSLKLLEPSGEEWVCFTYINNKQLVVFFVYVCNRSIAILQLWSYQISQKK